MGLSLVGKGTGRKGREPQWPHLDPKQAVGIVQLHVAQPTGITCKREQFSGTWKLP